jgi:protein-disulfide isomerase
MRNLFMVLLLCGVGGGCSPSKTTPPPAVTAKRVDKTSSTAKPALKTLTKSIVKVTPSTPALKAPVAANRRVVRPPARRAVRPRGARSSKGCEDGQHCTDVSKTNFRYRRRNLVGPKDGKKRADPAKMKELERTPGSTPVLAQVNATAFKKHASIQGVPGLSPAFGPNDAKVKVYVFSDFQCPVCRRVVEPVKHIARLYPKDLQVIFINNALKMHTFAEIAAKGALAAARQGKFWAFHDRLFQNQRALTETDMMNHARALKLDLDRFQKDMASPAIAKQIEYERNISQKLGVRGTPGFYINGTRMVGWGSTGGFQSMVQRALKKVGQLDKKLKPQKALEKATSANGDTGRVFAELVWGVKGASK